MLTIMIGLNVKQCYCDECVRESKYMHGVLPFTTILRGAQYRGSAMLEESSGFINSLSHRRCHTLYGAGLG